MLVLSRQQVRQVDHIAIHDFAMPGIVLMENAARGAAEIIQRTLPHARPLILCGGGNNGGDGLAIARHLHIAGSDVTIGLCTDPTKYTGDALTNWNIIQTMRLATHLATLDWIETVGRERQADGVVDAIFGTGLSSAPRDPFPAIAKAVRATKLPVAAIDIPSGLDCNTGMPLGPEVIPARVTITFVAMKAGFLKPAAKGYLGQVEVVGIGCPVEAIERAVKEGRKPD